MCRKFGKIRKSEKSRKIYVPAPLDTSQVTLSPEILQLCEAMAKNTHEQWAAQRISDGWTWGPERNDARKEHPMLIPYEELSESEKEYDRITSRETLKMLLMMGYQIEKTEVRNHEP